MLSPPVSGFIKRGKSIGIDFSVKCSPGLVMKKSAVLIFYFCKIIFATLLSNSLSNDSLPEAM